MPRKRLCECGECLRCKRRVYMRIWYARNTEKVKEAARRYREENIERVLAYDRERHRTPEYRARRAATKKPRTSVDRERSSQWKRENPEKVRAHSLLAYYVRTGKIERLPCEVCGAPKTHGHHDDYIKPLEVRWLCPLHHGEVHRRAA